MTADVPARPQHPPYWPEHVHPAMFGVLGHYADDATRCLRCHLETGYREGYNAAEALRVLSNAPTWAEILMPADPIAAQRDDTEATIEPTSEWLSHLASASRDLGITHSEESAS